MHTEQIVFLTMFAVIGALGFLLCRTREEDAPQEDVTKPALFLRVRNDGTYFISVRTFDEYEYVSSEFGPHSYPRS